MVYSWILCDRSRFFYFQQKERYDCINHEIILVLRLELYLLQRLEWRWWLPTSKICSIHMTTDKSKSRTFLHPSIPVYISWGEQRSTVLQSIRLCLSDGRVCHYQHWAWVGYFVAPLENFGKFRHRFLPRNLTKSLRTVRIAIF